MEDEILTVEKLQQGLGAVTGNDAPLVDDGDPLAERLGLLQIMSGQQDGHATGVELLDIGPKLSAQVDVDPCRGLVEHQDRRAVDHGLGHHQPPPHAAGKRTCVRIGFLHQSHRR